MSQPITVGISDLNATKAPGVLVTYALGSCVGICLYDPMQKSRDYRTLCCLPARKWLPQEIKPISLRTPRLSC